MIQGRWKLPVLREVMEGAHRFCDLQRTLSLARQGVSHKVAAKLLRELEADGLARRTVWRE